MRCLPAIYANEAANTRAPNALTSSGNCTMDCEGSGHFQHLAGPAAEYQRNGPSTSSTVFLPIFPGGRLRAVIWRRTSLLRIAFMSLG
jgi:hypothetical protein